MSDHPAKRPTVSALLWLAGWLALAAGALAALGGSGADMVLAGFGAGLVALLIMAAAKVVDLLHDIRAELARLNRRPDPG